MDEECQLRENLSEEYVRSMLGKYLNNFADQRQPVSKRLGFHSMNLVSPLMLQHQFICNYIESKDRDKVALAYSRPTALYRRTKTSRKSANSPGRSAKRSWTGTSRRRRNATGRLYGSVWLTQVRDPQRLGCKAKAHARPVREELKEEHHGASQGLQVPVHDVEHDVAGQPDA